MVEKYKEALGSKIYWQCVLSVSLCVYTGMQQPSMEVCPGHKFLNSPTFTIPKILNAHSCKQ